MTRRVHLCAVGALCAALLASPLPAQQTDCSTYALHGISPGMTAREVREAMGSKPDRTGDEFGPEGAGSSEDYRRESATVHVLYDRPLGKRNGARVKLVRVRTDYTDEYASAILASLEDRFGAPTEGNASPGVRLDEGPASWSDERCGMAVSVYRDTSEWWEASRPALFVEVRFESRPGRDPDDLLGLGPAPSDLPDRTPQPAAPPAVASAAPEPAGAEAALDSATPAVDRTDVPARPQTLVAGVGGVTEPELIPDSYVRPRYPRLAMKQRVEGTVLLQAIVTRNGTVGPVTVLETPRARLGFDEAAIEAVRQWRYRPATLDGEPVDATITVAINFAAEPARR